MDRLAASTEAKLVFPHGECVLTYEKLDTDLLTTSVGSDGSGATVVFIGTTRNSFQGKLVTKLEYQAYSKLAIATMADIARLQLAAPGSENIRCAVHHRLGTVPVGEASIVIAVSSPHRKEAFRICEDILEQVKAKAQIWKREYYANEREEDAQWKTNV